eukprot:COSAG01_NODE_251_length_20305_cov_5.846447_15_plen_98_part_00
MPVKTRYWVAVPRGLHPLRPNNVWQVLGGLGVKALMGGVLMGTTQGAGGRRPRSAAGAAEARAAGAGAHLREATAELRCRGARLVSSAMAARSRSPV